MRDYSAKDFDSYVAGLGTEARLKVEELRKVIRSTIPKAEEGISWGVPFYKHHGLLAGIAGHKNHASIWFPAARLQRQDRQTLEAKGYKTGEKTIQIKFDQKVPTAAIKQILKTQAKRNEAKNIGRPAKAGVQAKPTKARAGEKGAVVLLAGGNPQIAKGDGDAPVQAYIAAMPGWKRDVGRRLDALIVQAVPGVRKAVKWNSPFYGVEGRGWFLNFHCFTNYVKVAFFRGASLSPVPPGESKHQEVRYLDIREDALDEAQLATWVKQAAALPGWVP